jgi:hypothetical protein
MANYAFIKNQTVVNVAVFDNPTSELLEQFKNEFNLDKIVLTPHIYVEPLDSFVDGKFIPKKPFNGWLLNEEGYYWEPPIPYPIEPPLPPSNNILMPSLDYDTAASLSNDLMYTWDNETLSWVM